jgi:pimeloyl-ACP methyl ester carboxylesterase
LSAAQSLKRRPAAELGFGVSDVVANAAISDMRNAPVARAFKRQTVEKFGTRMRQREDTMLEKTGSGTGQKPATEMRRDTPTYYKTLARSGYAPVDGLRMYYEIHGTAAARPLVTIHPFAGLANVFPSLVRNRQLIAMELQGHGRTADIDRPMSFEQDADDVAALLKHLRIERADFFGESFGGIVALLMAVRHPELVRRVALYAAALGKFQEVTRPESLAEFMTLTPEHSSIQFQREDYERVAPDPAQWPTLFTKTTRRVWNGFSHEELSSISVPVLIAAGDHDVLGPRLEHHLDMSRRIPGAQLAVIPDAGHFLLNDDPEKLLPVVATFFDQPESKVPFATTLSGYHPGKTR